MPLLAYHVDWGDGTLADGFAEERGRSLPPEERAWLDAQRAAWLSIWEVEETQMGVGVRVRDLLTGTERFVHDISASKILARWDAVLGRVADYGKFSVFAGMHHRPLPPEAAARVVEGVRRFLRCRTSDVPVERLRLDSVALALLGAWRDVLRMLEQRAQKLVLQNTDGDRLLLTKDRYTFDPEVRAELLRRLATLTEVDSEDVEDGQPVVTFTRHAQGHGEPRIATPGGGAVRLQHCPGDSRPRDVRGRGSRRPYGRPAAMANNRMKKSAPAMAVRIIPMRPAPEPSVRG